MIATAPFTKTRISFYSQGKRCVGYVYCPADDRERRPCVIMANGFSGTMDWILPAFAERFARTGFTVLVFDYRHLGESDGYPRQLINVNEQRADLREAIKYMQEYPGIDGSKLILWGTSLGGSHVIEVAAADQNVAAVIANMPAIDMIKGANIREKMARMKIPFWQVLLASAQLLAAAVLDAIRNALGYTPYYIKVYGVAGKAFFADPALAERFRVVTKESRTWKNLAAPRFLFQPPKYTEGTMEKIRVPLLVCLAKNDVEISSDFIKRKAINAVMPEIREYPYEHFDMYHGEPFEQVVADQVDFLKRHFL